ncbi:hypothetical protein Pmani_013332 [Petrolisthes manimaculis]|uniref:Uncharacterized protein n=1 Tax=Petrolisthes manimaculis TaxID=1843537 RepID=A0AAE1PXF5_9EUCA|nr:hypothetical protein Pmani_013332 [Petrolisthes manimaculis]
MKKERREVEEGLFGEEEDLGEGTIKLISPTFYRVSCATASPLRQSFRSADTVDSSEPATDDSLQLPPTITCFWVGPDDILVDTITDGQSSEILYHKCPDRMLDEFLLLTITEEGKVEVNVHLQPPHVNISWTLMLALTDVNNDTTAAGVGSSYIQDNETTTSQSTEVGNMRCSFLKHFPNITLIVYCLTSDGCVAV